MGEYGKSEEDNDWDRYLVENLSLAYPDQIRFETANRTASRKSRTAPRKADMPPSVTTNGGTFSLVIAKPCINPPATPTAIAARAARNHGLLAAASPAPTVNRLERPPLDTAAATNPAKATSEPIERSMPAVNMTKVIPTASRP